MVGSDKFKQRHCWNCISITEQTYINDILKREQLLTFSWVKIVTKMKNEFYLLLSLISLDLFDVKAVNRIFSRLEFVYSVRMQAKASDMSLMQWMMSGSAGCKC